MMLRDLLQRTLVKQPIDKRKDAENEVDDDGDDDDDDDDSKGKLNEAELRKEVAISAHNQALQQYAMMESCLKPSVPSHPSSSVPLQGLLSITLSELREGHVHAGRVVFGTLCVDAFSIKGIMSVLLGVNSVRPSKHAHAVRVAIYNAAMPSDTISDIRARYPKGIAIAIKEPFLKRAADGLLLLRVDNPGNIERVSSHDNPCISPPPSSSRIDASDLRRMGDRLSMKKDWKGAIRCYTKCITLIQGKLGNDRNKDLMLVEHDAVSSSNDTTTAIIADEPNMLALAFSNRAQAWMKLNKYNRALKDADAALSIDPSHVKSLICKGRALHSLKQLEYACSCFEMALSLSPDAPDVRAFLDTSKRCLDESSSDTLARFSDFLLGKSISPMLHDHIGPVVVKETRNKSRGRGLFTTKSVKHGTLLVVSNAIAMCREDSKHFAIRLDDNRNRINRISQENLVTKLVRLGMESPKHLHQIYALYSSKSSSSMSIPSMDLFIEAIETEETLKIDVTRIRDIVQFNSFSTYQVSTMDDDVYTTPQHLTGLWLLPSFINHSCIPNATWTIVGKAMVIHASSDISSGDEITIPYFDTLIPLKMREKFGSNWGFVCRCNRCVLEKSMEVEMEDKVRRFEYLYDQATDEYVSSLSDKSPSKKKTSHVDAAFPACSMISKLYSMISQQVDEMRHLTDIQKKWILGSFSHAFVAKYFLSWKAHKFDTPMYRSAIKMLDIVRACEPGSVITVNLAARLYAIAMEARKPRQSSSLLLEAWKHDCVSHFGEQKSIVLEKLSSKITKTIPSFLNSSSHEDVSVFS